MLDCFPFISKFPPLTNPNHPQSQSQSQSHQVTTPPMLLCFLIAAESSAASPALEPPPSSSTLNPAIAVAIAMVTTFFCITSLLLLYTKHCTSSGSSPPPPLAGLRHCNSSGVDRSLIESLPVFKFGALKGEKQGLECAVCLTRFEMLDSLRLLPKCKHAFHVECVDTWLDAHSTCPLCRCRVDRGDLLLVVEQPEESIRRISSERRSRLRLPPSRLAVTLLGSAPSDQVRPCCSCKLPATPNSLRLMPKCKHAFHVECVDTWLDAHSTCPLCKCRVDRGDLRLVVEQPEESLRRISGERCSNQRRKDGMLMMGKMEHRILVSRWSDVAPTSALVCLRGGRSASDMGLGSDATALARWTAWISQAQAQAQG